MEGVEPPRGVGCGEGLPCGEGVSPPHWDEVWEGLCPLPRKFLVFLVENTVF